MSARMHVERILAVLRTGASGIHAMEQAVASADRTAVLEEREPADMRERSGTARAQMRIALSNAIGVQEEHVREASRHGATADEIASATGWSADRVDGLLRAAT
jgi:hypothetical protein